MKRTGKTPRLRFPDFDGDWVASKVADVTTYVDYRGKTPPKSESGVFLVTAKNVKIGHIDYECSKEYIPTELYDAVMRRGRPRLGDVLITTEAPLGNVASIDRSDVALAQRIIKLRGKETILSNNFLQHILLSQSFQKLLRTKSSGSTAKGIKGSVLHKLPLVFPSLAEQEKVAAFLSSVDEKIRLLARKRALLVKYKKGLMQHIFDQQLRFKDDNGDGFSDWKAQSLITLLREHKTRNSNNDVTEVFSVAKNSGVINQLEHLGRSYAAKNTSNYNVLLPGDIVYTKSPTSQFPYGIIKQNKTGRTGIVSALYAVFTPKNPQLGLLLDYYFSSWVKTYNYLNPIVQKGAKNTINIGNDDFLRGNKIKLPTSPQEIQKIVRFLSLLEDKVRLSERELERTKTFKKGLLQQMFV